MSVLDASLRVADEGAPALLIEIAVELESRLDYLTDGLLDRAARELESLGIAARALARPIRRGASAAMRDALVRLGTNAGPPRELPPETEHVVHVWARAGLEVGALIGVFFLGGEEFWEEFDQAMSLLSPPAADGLEAQRHAQRSLWAYAERLQRLLREAYDREHHLLRADPESRAGLLVAQILSGDAPRSGEWDYDFSEHHLALIAWGEEAAAGVDAVAKAAGGRLISCPAPDGALWGWFGAGTPFSDEDIGILMDWARSVGVCMAFGEAGRGIEGFRRSHWQALEARAGLDVDERAVTRYGDAGLLGLLRSTDRSRARQFVDQELAGLLGHDSRSEDLRRTLAVHLTHGQRTGSTGKALGIDRHTVRERLDEIEHRSGTRIEERSAELRVALMLLGSVLDG